MEQVLIGYGAAVLTLWIACYGLTFIVNPKWASALNRAVFRAVRYVIGAPIQALGRAITGRK